MKTTIKPKKITKKKFLEFGEIISTKKKKSSEQSVYRKIE